MTDCNHLWAWKKTQVMQGPSCSVFIKIKEKRPIAKIVQFVREGDTVKTAGWNSLSKYALKGHVGFFVCF